MMTKTSSLLFLLILTLTSLLAQAQESTPPAPSIISCPPGKQGLGIQTQDPPYSDRPATMTFLDQSAPPIISLNEDVENTHTFIVCPPLDLGLFRATVTVTSQAFRTNEGDTCSLTLPEKKIHKIKESSLKNLNGLNLFNWVQGLTGETLTLREKKLFNSKCHPTPNFPGHKTIQKAIIDLERDGKIQRIELNHEVGC